MSKRKKIAVQGNAEVQRWNNRLMECSGSWRGGHATVKACPVASAHPPNSVTGLTVSGLRIRYFSFHRFSLDQHARWRMARVAWPSVTHRGEAVSHCFCCNNMFSVTDAHQQVDVVVVACMPVICHPDHCGHARTRYARNAVRICVPTKWITMVRWIHTSSNHATTDAKQIRTRMPIHYPRIKIKTP